MISRCVCRFRVFDQDGDGKISQAELKAILETDEDVQKSLGGEMSSIEKIMLEVDILRIRIERATLFSKMWPASKDSCLNIKVEI